MMEKMSVSEITEDSKRWYTQSYERVSDITIVENEKTARIPAGSFG